jgi:enediyne biosynthesis protein E5
VAPVTGSAPAPAQGGRDTRLASLRRFALAITVLSVLGYTVLGFEQAWAHPLAALATAYSLELLFEWLDARANGRPPRFVASKRAFVDFLLPAHITGLAVAMLLYSNERVAPVVFATTVAIGSKVLVRAPVAGGRRHVLNPSNIGITATLLAFPWVGIAPPYMFTENLSTLGDWLLPAIIVASGTLLNGTLTGRLPLVAGWIGGFIVQALVRAALTEASLLAALGPLTGTAVVLYTFYMITDPATTPQSPRAQAAFGFAVAATYGALLIAHVVFGLFFALTIVCLVRGVYLLAKVRFAARLKGGVPVRMMPRRVRVEP